MTTEAAERPSFQDFQNKHAATNMDEVMQRLRDLEEKNKQSEEMIASYKQQEEARKQEEKARKEAELAARAKTVSEMVYGKEGVPKSGIMEVFKSEGILDSTSLPEEEVVKAFDTTGKTVEGANLIRVAHSSSVKVRLLSEKTKESEKLLQEKDSALAQREQRIKELEAQLENVTHSEYTRRMNASEACGTREERRRPREDLELQQNSSNKRVNAEASSPEDVYEQIMSRGRSRYTSTTVKHSAASAQQGTTSSSEVPGTALPPSSVGNARSPAPQSEFNVSMDQLRTAAKAGKMVYVGSFPVPQQ